VLTAGSVQNVIGNVNLTECTYCNNKTLKRFATYYYQAQLTIEDHDGQLQKVNIYRHQFLSMYNLIPNSNYYTQRLRRPLSLFNFTHLWFFQTQCRDEFSCRACPSFGLNHQKEE